MENKSPIMVIILMLFFCALPRTESFAEPDVEKWERSIVRVYNDSKSALGTGWVASDGIIATNNHVIDGGTSFHIFLAGTTPSAGVAAELVWSDARLDLALLRVTGLGAPALKFHTKDPARGSVAYTAGYPAMADAAAQGMSAQISIYSGSISLVVAQGQTGRRTIQHDTIVNAGNSGGPLLDACGRVLGVTSEGYSDAEVNLVWLSVHVAELAREMDRLKIAYTVDNSACQNDVIEQAAKPDQEAREAAQSASDSATQARQSVESLENKLYKWGVLLLAALAILLVLILKRPREKMGEVLADVSKAMGRTKAQNQSNKAKSIVLSGFSSAGKTIRIEFENETLAKAGKGISIGRSPQLSDYAIDDKEISRRHARISMRAGQYYIEDLNSTNGTKLNGQGVTPFQPQVLVKGDVVKMGQIELSIS